MAKKKVTLTLDEVRRACIEFAVRYKDLRVYKDDIVQAVPSDRTFTITIEVKDS